MTKKTSLRLQNHKTIIFIFIELFFFVFLSGLFGCREKATDIKTHPFGSQSDTFFIAFYNVENLFDDNLDGNEYIEYCPDLSNWNDEMVERKFCNIASVIASLNPSVIGLCEVEDNDALEMLKNKLAGLGVSYPFGCIAGLDSKTNTRPALLSRFPIVRSAGHEVSFPDGSFSRPILEAEIQINDRPFILFVNHWPSKRRPESFRLRAAEILTDRITQLPPGADYCIIGDFNSNCDEFSTFTTSGHNDTHDSTGINHLLGTIQYLCAGEARLKTEREVISAAFPSHYDLWSEIPENDRMSYYYRGNRQTLDHIIIPPALFDSSGISYVDNSYFVYKWEGRLLLNGMPFGWKMKYKGNMKFHVGEGYSDHLPIAAAFTLRPFTFASETEAVAAGETVDSASCGGWFEFHSNGWIACDNTTSLERDSTQSAKGKYSIHLKAAAKNSNRTVAATAIVGRDLDKDGKIRFMIRGKGTLCFRTKTGKEKWRYHLPDNDRFSKAARYVPIDYNNWQTVVFSPASSVTFPIALELRVSKNTELDIFIDK